jgi:hypothetical protein
MPDPGIAGAAIGALTALAPYLGTRIDSRREAAYLYVAARRIHKRGSHEDPQVSTLACAVQPPVSSSAKGRRAAPSLNARAFPTKLGGEGLRAIL